MERNRESLLAPRARTCCRLEKTGVTAAYVASFAKANGAQSQLCFQLRLPQMFVAFLECVSFRIESLVRGLEDRR